MLLLSDPQIVCTHLDSQLHQLLRRTGQHAAIFLTGANIQVEKRGEFLNLLIERLQKAQQLFFVHIVVILSQAQHLGEDGGLAGANLQLGNK